MAYTAEREFDLPTPSQNLMPLASRKLEPVSSPIPDRLYFRIGDVARICGVETYVLRFWETQFPQLRPNKSGTGQRLYRKRDVELALDIKRLVHGEGYTIAGARQALNPATRRETARPATIPISPVPVVEAPQPQGDKAAALASVRAGLRELVGILAEEPSQATRPTANPRQRQRTIQPSSDTGLLFPL